MDRKDDGLEHMTVKQLRQLAREEGVCPGYEGTTKRGIVGAIRSHRWHMAHLDWDPLETSSPMTKCSTTTGVAMEGGQPWRSTRR